MQDLKVHMHDIYGSFFTIFWHHSIIDKAEAQNFKKVVKISVKYQYMTGFSRIPRYRRKRTVSLHVFCENATFNSPRIRQKRIISLLLLIRCTLPKARSFTPHFRRQRLG
jgi:hypothetical protein